MLIKIKKYFLIYLTLVFLLCPILSIRVQAADNSKTAEAFSKDKYGLYDTANKAGLLDTAISKKSSPLDIAADILGIALSFLGIVFFGIMLYAGIRWMTALGDSQKVETSKGMLESAGIGLIIILASYAIATYVFNYLGIS